MIYILVYICLLFEQTKQYSSPVLHMSVIGMLCLIDVLLLKFVL